MEVSYLYGLSVLFGVGFGISLLFRFLRLPSVVGFIIGGMLLGPFGLGVYSEELVPLLIDAGAVLLLFVAGLELSKAMNRSLFSVTVKSALLQLFINFVSFSFLYWALNLRVRDCFEVIITGFVLSLSSTALAVRFFQDRGEMETSYGIVSTTALLFQDIATICFLMLLMVTRGIKSGGEDFLSLVLGGILVVGVIIVIVGAKNNISRFVGFVASKGGRDVLTLFALFFGITGAGIALRLGWSAGLGACMAGIILGQSDEKHQLVAEVQPFQDVIYALFFISLGMCFPLDWAISNAHLVGLGLGGIMFLKMLFNVFSLSLGGNSARLSVLVSVALLPISEFSFIVGREAYKLGFVDESWINFIVSITIMSMILGSFPLLYLDNINKIVIYFSNKFSENKIGRIDEKEEIINIPHVVIIGFGLTGENLAKVLNSTKIPFVVIEMNKELAQQAKKLNPLKLIIGDATQSIILSKAGLETAQAVVVGVNDPVACRKIVGQISTGYPNTYILVRTRFAKEVDVLRKLGAHQVVPEDFETSIEVVAHVLKRCGVPDNIVEAEIIAIRADGYAMLRGKATTRAGMEEIIKILEQTTTQTYYLEKDSIAVGKSLSELDLRKQTGCSVIAVVRGGKPFPGPSGDFVLKENDLLVLVGSHAQIESARKILDHKVI